MINYEFEHSETTTASAEAIWALWSAVNRWPEWDSSLERIELTGPFEAGTTGTMILPGRPPISFTITEVQPGHGFTDETEVPGGVLRFRHSLEITDGRTVVTHRVEIDGPAEMAGKLGPMVTEDVPEAVRDLVRLAEAHCTV
jgi:ligand-binding SRPBCC domain-containing protein